MYVLTDAEKAILLERLKVSYSVLKDADIIVEDGESYIKIREKDGHSVCFCSGNKGKKINGNVCLECGSDVGSRYFKVVNKELLTKMNDTKIATGKYIHWGASTSQNVSLANFFYVKKNPNKEGILILKINVSVKAGKDRMEDEKVTWKIEKQIEITPGEKSGAYKFVRGEKVEIDLFDSMQLNSKTVKEAPNAIFEDAYGPIDFMLKHKTVGKYTGFMECFNMVDVLMPRTSFFFFYMYIYAQYPAVEFVIKNGYVSLLAQIMKNVSSGCNKEVVRNNAKMLRRIVNPEATNGTTALTVPKYIADDLNRKRYSVDQYILWGDIAQMSPVSASKENYFKYTRTNTYVGLGYSISEIPNVMRHGYTFGEIIKYLDKQKEVLEKDKSFGTCSFHHVFNLFKDYLNMCDIMQVVPDKFPHNIKTVHDNTAMAFSAMQNAIADSAIKLLSEEAKKCIPDTQIYRDSEYEIQLPMSSYDIIQEGQNMHNCVGSYINNVVRRSCLIFFIRLKEEPDHSYVTAEYRNGHLRQIYYKNNRPVSNKDIIDIANSFCEKLYNSHKFMF